jgi:uncharacterized protein YaaQ
MPKREIDLLILIIISQSQSKKLMANLNKQHFYFTVIDSSSSLYHEPTVCLLMGLNHTRLETLKRLVEKYCQPYHKFIPVQMRGVGELSRMPVIESLEGGAIMYGMHVERFEQI